MRALSIIPALFLLTVACGGDSSRSEQPTASPLSSGSALPPGTFRLAALGPSSEGASRYLASTSPERSGCSFEIVVTGAKPASGSLFSFASAALVRRPKSDCSAFLRALAPELGFKGTLPTPQRLSRLDAKAAILGTNQSRHPEKPEVAGSFSSQPPGHWTVMKLFLQGGDGEVFLNLNSSDGVGAFSFKDEDYASIVVTDLAKVFLPEQ